MCCLPTPLRISSMPEAQCCTILEPCLSSTTTDLRSAMFTRSSVSCPGSMIRWYSSPSLCSSVSSSRTRFQSSLVSGATDLSSPPSVYLSFREHWQPNSPQQCNGHPGNSFSLVTFMFCHPTVLF